MFWNPLPSGAVILAGQKERRDGSGWDSVAEKGFECRASAQPEGTVRGNRRAMGGGVR